MPTEAPKVEEEEKPAAEEGEGMPSLLDSPPMKGPVMMDDDEDFN